MEIREAAEVKKTIPFITASALAFLAAAQGAPIIQLSVKPEREVIYSEGSREAIVQIALQAKKSDEKRKTPLNLALVLDRSGSMAGTKLEKAKQAACLALDQLGEDDYFSVVTYDDEAEVLIAPSKVTDRDAIKRKINRISDGGSTALYAGVEKGAAQIRKYMNDEKINRIILLSDGMANVGPSTPAALAKLGKELRMEEFGVSTVGLGDDYNEDLMTALAEASHANYYYVQDAENLPGIFHDELGTVKNIVARNVTIKITLPEGIDDAAFIGENDIAFRGRSVTIPLSEFYGSQTRRFLVSCKLPKGEKSDIELAKIELSYQDADGMNGTNESVTAKVRQSDDIAEAEKSVRGEVAANVAITQNRVTKERALALADEGKSKEAAALLQTQVSTNAGLPAFAQSEQLKKEETGLLKRVSELLSNGRLSKESRKSVQYENYQDKNSKR